MSWNPGIGRKKGQGQAVELCALEWKIKGQGQAVELRVLESWKGRNKGKDQAVKLRVLESWNRREKRVRVRLSNFVSWNPGIEGEKGSGSSSQTSCPGIMERKKQMSRSGRRTSCLGILK